MKTLLTPFKRLEGVFSCWGPNLGLDRTHFGNFPSSDKQPYLEVAAHLNINTCARSVCARLLAAFSRSD